jgi:hypothetical protein
VRPAVRDAFVRACTGTGALRRPFSSCRTLPTSAQQIQDAVGSGRRLTMSTMTIGAHPVGTALEQQVRPVADDLTGHLIENCGHIIPLHRPDVLLGPLRPVLVTWPVLSRPTSRLA